MNGVEWINRTSPVALHEQCKNLLMEQIENGSFQTGRPIPTEKQLCEKYGLSRTTIRQAVGELVEAGILKKIQGRGTFVIKSIIPLDLQRLTSFSEDMRARGKVAASKILTVERVKPDPQVVEALNTTSEVLKIERLRYASGRIMGLHTAYLSRVLDITPGRFALEPSLYNILLRDYHIELVTADETLEASAATTVEAELLNLAPGAPILRIERISYDRLGVPQEFVHIRYRADQYKYYVRLKR
jgi:GntR family transcriptional regulator